MIIFLNGSINSGKTTIANLLVKKIPNTAHIEVDDLRQFIDWMSLEESIPINLENTVSLIKNFVNKRLNVVITYPLSKENYDYLMQNLRDLNEKIYTFTLNPSIDKALSRGRSLTDWEKNRIQYHYQTGINNPDFGDVIDNTDHSPEETAEEILSRLKY